MAKIKTAVIGLGMGKFHVMGYSKNPEADVVAVADLDASRFPEIEKLIPGVRTYTDAKALLREVKPDLVSVAVPNFLHEEITCAALHAGAHVLCEKPMSMNLDSALRMRNAASTANRQLFINFSQRFGGFARTAKDLVEAGELGDIYHAYCQWTRRDGIPRFGGWFGQKDKSGGGPLIDLGVHRLDFVLWLMGHANPTTVSGMTHARLGTALAKTEKKSFDVEDFAAGFIRTDKNSSILFEVSWTGFQTGRDRQQLRVMGEKGTLEAGPGVHGEYTLHLCHNIAGHAFNATELHPQQAPSSYETLISCLQSGEPFPATAEDGIRLQIILDALYASAAQGHEIEVAKFAGPAMEYLTSR